MRACVLLQASLLLEAESFAGRVQSSAESWAEQMETLLTEELDGRLRAHRPRAGRIEEEVRSTLLAASSASKLDSHTRDSGLAERCRLLLWQSAIAWHGCLCSTAVTCVPCHGCVCPTGARWAQHRTGGSAPQGGQPPQGAGEGRAAAAGAL